MASTKIELRAFPATLPTLFRLLREEATEGLPGACLVYEEAGGGWFQLQGEIFEVRHPDVGSLIGDVILANPRRGTGERLVRQGSAHNTLLVTERCDQLCVMCSQPPKDYELDLFEVHAQALQHAPRDSVIGLSGGEPLLYKAQVFALIEQAARARPDLGFHLLTNAQHLVDADLPALARLPHARLRFAVPLYAADAETHDRIVEKPGAFARALEGLAILMEAGAEVEIRTVILQQNAGKLVQIARFLADTLPDIDHWALMQLEYIGLARKNWASIFFDHSLDARGLSRAVALAEQHGVECRLYNTPLCTLPPALRSRAPRTISDWKQSYFPQCDACSQKAACSGVFAWARPEQSFRIMEPV